MNNHEHTIHYTFDKDGYCSTNCPHCDFLLRVGSKVCYQCTHFVSHDYKRRIVTCKCPENHKLTDFEPSIFFQ